MIKAGDLVIVTNPCCSARRANAFLGHIRRVTEVVGDWRKCEVCGFSYGTWAQFDRPLSTERAEEGLPVPFLKRIDPLPENEETKEREELRV